MKREKKRIDLLIFEKNMIESREKAKRIIMAGYVLVNNEVIDKPGTKVFVDAEIIIKKKEKYVSRGGYKLEKALNIFNLDIINLTCMDIGASTGGFTDCMMQNKAKKIYAIDVGYGQLDWRIRNDSKVVVFERTNFRNIDTDSITDKIDFFSIDVSFISLKHIFPKIFILGGTNSIVIALIKPQFEAGRDKVEKNGIIKNIDTHHEVLHNVIKHGEKNNLYLNNLSFSPIKGTRGNIEYLAYFTKNSVNNYDDIALLIDKTVNEAFQTLNY